MTCLSLRRIVIALAAPASAGIATAIWVAPNEAARAFGLEAIGAGGAASLRADLGGLFAALAVLCAAAAWTQKRSWQIGAALVIGAIVTGRTFAWIANGPAGDATSLAIEIALLIALLMSVRSTPSAPARGRRRAAVTIAVVLAVATGFAAMSADGVTQSIYDRAALSVAGAANTAPLADDALRVAICGSSAPLPSPARAKACVAVFAGGKFYIVDAGPESVENLVLWGIPMKSIGGVLLTHFHSDHIGDLGELNLQTWANGRPGPLTVYGGPGVEAVVDGFNAAYRLDQGYRTEHHGAEAMPPQSWPMIAQPIAMSGEATGAKDRSNTVLVDGALTIHAFEVDHSPIAPAYAYRFAYKGRSVLVTGDLKFHPPLVKAAMGADVMVSEAISYGMTRALGAAAKSGGRDSAAKILHDIEDYHITPEQASQIANDANVKLLVFYHLLPAPDGWLPRRLFAQGIDEARQGEWTIADDGNLYTLPIGSAEIRRGVVAER